MSDSHRPFIGRPRIRLTLVALAVCCACDSSSDGSDTDAGSSSTSGSSLSDTAGSTNSNGSSASDSASTVSTSSPSSTRGSSDGDSSDDGPGDTSGDDDSSDDGSTPPGDCFVEEWFTSRHWDSMFLHVDDPACPGTGSYTYDGFIAAAANYPTFGCEGDEDTRRREVAAFLAQISHETTGGWATAPDGPYSWGLCFNEEVACVDGGCTQYCDASNVEYPCAAGQTYHGRGAMQLSWNYNYGQAGADLGVDILADPGLVVADPELAIGTALWFWMTTQSPKPSAHDVMVGNWMPSESDLALGRVPGFGMTTNIINGGIECNQPTTPAVQDRVGFFERYAMLVKTSVGDNLLCDQMASY